MKITQVKSQIVKLPAEEPLAGGSGFHRPFFEFVILQLYTDEGIEGIGVTFFGWTLTAALKRAVEQLSELIIGDDPLRIEALGGKIRNAAAGAGPGGISTLAASAIDMALWDLKGKALGLSVAAMLGGLRDRVPTYASGALSRFAWNDAVYRVPESQLRHIARDCATLQAAVAATAGWVDQVENTIDLRTRTVRCTDCWQAYEQDEERRAAAGDANRADDRRFHALGQHDALVQRIEPDSVPGASRES